MTLGDGWGEEEADPSEWDTVRDGVMGCADNRRFKPLALHYQALTFYCAEMYR